MFSSILEKCSSTTVSRNIGLSICAQVFTLFSEIPDSFFFEKTAHLSETIPEEEALPNLVMSFMRLLLEAVTDYSDLISCTALESLKNFVLHKKQTAGLDSDTKFKSSPNCSSDRIRPYVSGRWTYFCCLSTRRILEVILLIF